MPTCSIGELDEQDEGEKKVGMNLVALKWVDFDAFEVV